MIFARVQGRTVISRFFVGNRDLFQAVSVYYFKS